MNPIAEMIVSTPEQFIRAIRLSQNVFESRTVIRVKNHGESFGRGSELTGDIQYGITSLYRGTAGSFAGAQLSRFSVQMMADPFGRFANVLIRARYFSSPKELNDLICVAAEIAALLNQNIRHPDDEMEKIHLFDRWVRKHFRYQDTHQIEDHMAISLLKKRSGVCQAIAALAVLVLSYMGVKILYVPGEGRGTGGWGPHAWNAAKIRGRWIHLDFTFSMNAFRLPGTRSGIEEKLFARTHRWDQREFSPHSMDVKWNHTWGNEEEGILIRLKADRCLIYGVEVRFSDELLKKEVEKVLVDLAAIVRLLGGGIELIPSTGTLHVCVWGKRIVVKDALAYVRDGYFDQDILNRIWKHEWVSDRELQIRIQAVY